MQGDRDEARRLAMQASRRPIDGSDQPGRARKDIGSGQPALGSMPVGAIGGEGAAAIA